MGGAPPAMPQQMAQPMQVQMPPPEQIIQGQPPMQAPMYPPQQVVPAQVMPQMQAMD